MKYNGGFPGGIGGKIPACHAGEIRDASAIPGLGRFPGGEQSKQAQYSCLENPMNRRAWQAILQFIGSHRV